MTWAVGIYETEAAAKRVAARLTKAGLRDRKVFHAGRLAGKEETAVQVFAKDAGLPFGDVKGYARTLQEGRSLVAVKAPPDRAPEAIDILKSTAMTTSEIGSPPAGGGPQKREKAPEEAVRPDDPAPFSRMLGMRPLGESKPSTEITLKDDPAPFSRMLGMRVLSESKPSGEITLKTAPSATILKDDPAPLSSMLGWATLTKSAPYADIKLSDDPAPLSTMMGLATLSKKDS